MRNKPIVLALAALAAPMALAGCATVEIVEPTWRTVPDGEAMSDAYPGFAAAIGIHGRVRLRCVAGPDGKLNDCEVDQASPVDLGFERAALSLTDRFETTPGLRDGVAASSQVRFTIVFALPDHDANPPWEGAEPSAEALSLARDLAPRMTPSMTSGPGGVVLDGLPADRVEAVQAMIVEVDAETRPKAVEAVALAIARVTPVEDLRRAATGRGGLTRPNVSDETLQRAGDRVVEINLQAEDRLKTLYCARYDCADIR